MNIIRKIMVMVGVFYAGMVANQYVQQYNDIAQGPFGRHLTNGQINQAVMQRELDKVKRAFNLD